MKDYVITAKAGRIVAGQRNPGVGLSLTLSDKQAEAALREGAIVERKADDAKSAESSGEDKAKRSAASTDKK